MTDPVVKQAARDAFIAHLGAPWDAPAPASDPKAYLAALDAAVEAAAPLMTEASFYMAGVAAERERIVAEAREMGATYPVTLDPQPGSERAPTRTAFPFADYLEDVP